LLENASVGALIRVGFFAIGFLTLSGCGRVAQRPAPTAEDVRVARQAMAISEVSLMLRSGYKEQVIIAEISRRHVPEKPDVKTEAMLLRSGASPALIQALRNDANVLTRNQKRAYDNLAADRAGRAEQKRAASEDEAPDPIEAENRERQRKQLLAQQTLQIARNTEERVEAYDKADRAYKKQKQSLQNQIAIQEALINRLRSFGQKEDQLTEHNAKLNRLKEQLRDLKEPMR
jgi:hypothetical protein